ncbi:protein Wnt-6-like isoform X2 [Ruditapes philippinarum]|uniref:protein Wnt-6-like isoform X2 n=1 Tax=Ruditapes philippinarum TaxID=129788 RepID=UPI00295B3985|nr:protein Wnt-6-like isoform X2 [Ruditapes philippinarum]
MRKQGFYVCLYFYLMFPANIIGLWWAVGSPLVMEPNKICRKNRKLSGKQRQICRREKEIVDEVVNGAKLAIAECQYQFQYRRWNCTTARKSFSRILRRETRESAFVHAITAAGALFTIGKACAEERLKCGCKPDKHQSDGPKGALWIGCDDGVNYGYEKSKEFIDEVGGDDLNTKIRLHNQEAGRLAVSKHMEVRCKCHGWATACGLKTCWKVMPSFRDIGTRLLEQFSQADRVRMSADGKLVSRWLKEPPAKEALVYAKLSQNFCEPRKKYGSLGTHGRLCNETELGLGGCELMCCGRGYSMAEEMVTETCNCEFNCETCSYAQNITRCL